MGKITEAGTVGNLVDAVEALQAGQNIVFTGLSSEAAVSLCTAVKNKLYRERRKSQKIADFDYDNFSYELSIDAATDTITVTFKLSPKPKYQWKVIDSRE